MSKLFKRSVVKERTGMFARSGFNPDEPRDENGMWTTGGATKEGEFKEAKDLKEAEDFAKNNLAKEVSYEGIDLEIANAFNKQLLEVKTTNDLPMLDSIKTVDEIGGKNSLAAFISYKNDPEISIQINKKQFEQVKLIGYENYFNKLSGSHEMKNLEGLAKHEATHYFQRTKMKGFNDNEMIHEAFRSGELLKSSSSMSRYSYFNKEEFMAELSTAKFNGKKMSDIFVLNRDTKNDYNRIEKLYKLL